MLYPSVIVTSRPSFTLRASMAPPCLFIARAEDRMGLAPVPDWAPDAYGCPPGMTALCATRISFARDGTRAEVSRGWIDTGVATYVARLA